MIIEIDNHCPGRNLKCCDGCQRLGNITPFSSGTWHPEIRKGSRGQADYCLHRVAPASEIKREIEEMPF